jgi:putative FmdB family regulatory protein
MLYDYKCDACSHEMNDVYQSIKDEALTDCPKCGKPALYRVIYGGLGSFMKDAKTIGQLADHNWSKLGSYQKSEIEAQRKSEAPQQDQSFSKFGSATKKEINKMTQPQKERYIITGEK